MARTLQRLLQSRTLLLSTTSWSSQAHRRTLQAPQVAVWRANSDKARDTDREEGTSESSIKEEEDSGSERHRDAEKEPLSEWPGGVNPHSGEKGGPRGPEPTRYGDWERKGRVSDF